MYSCVFHNARYLQMYIPELLVEIKMLFWAIHVIMSKINHNLMLKIIRSTNRTDKCKIRKRITVIMLTGND